MRPRHIPSILQLTKSIWQQVTSEWYASGIHPVLIDGTVGNGHDTLFLTELCGEKCHVYGFDIQVSGLVNTQERLEEAGMASRATLIHAGHETAAEHLPEGTVVSGGMFNLGYLPGGDHAVITRAQTTIASLKALLPLLQMYGVFTVHIYTGHEGGVVEGDAIRAWSKTLAWNKYRVAQYDFPNKNFNKEYLIVIERID